MELSEVGNGKLWFLRLVEELQRRDRRAPPASSPPAEPRAPRPKPLRRRQGERRRGAREARRTGR
jgi:hypothetical protein